MRFLQILLDTPMGQFEKKSGKLVIFKSLLLQVDKSQNDMNNNESSLTSTQHKCDTCYISR